MEWLSLFGITLGITLLVMLLSWAWAVKVNNFGIVDAVWAFCFLLHALIFAFLSEGFLERKILLTLMLGLWSFRLGYYLTKRIYSHHPDEDTRYKHLRAEYGDKFKMRFMVFYFYQAISVSVLTLPFIFVFKNATPEINSFEIIAFVYWLVSVCGESLADHQLNTFKHLSKNNPQMGRTCNIGLWKYSRHPNYFFESNIWWGFFIFMMGSQIYWGVYCALIILFLLLKVTGVPPSEAQALKSRGDEYVQYQRKTSAFIPWFPKS